MTELLVHSPTNTSPTHDAFWTSETCRTLLIPRYSLEDKVSPPKYSELRHSKSDDLILHNAPLDEPELQHGISEDSMQIQKEACVVYEDDIGNQRNSTLLTSYFSDSESQSSTSNIPAKSIPKDMTSNMSLLPATKPVLKLTGDFSRLEGHSRRNSKFIDTVYDKIDPEDSIRDIVSENDFYRFVLFKRHYEKYLDVSRQCEEARNLAYYLEEKYHEIKVERDTLVESNKQLEEKLDKKEVELHEKEDELFLQLEKAVRLEEDCEKLRKEKEKLWELKDQLEKEKNEAYRMLKLQAEDSEGTRRRLEKARNDVMRKVTEIVSEKNALEKENSRLKEIVGDLERRMPKDGNRPLRKKIYSPRLQREVSELKFMAKQSATLNSKLKQGMRHLASCKRRKCSVCAYTRSTFGEYTAPSSSNCAGCFPFHAYPRDRDRATNLRNSTPRQFSPEEVASRLSRCSLTRSDPLTEPLYMSYIDELSSGGSCTPDCSEEEGESICWGREEEEDVHTPPSHLHTSAGKAFSSDSGISSERCDSSMKTPKLQRATRWTSSFRKLIRRVSVKRRESAGTYRNQVM